MVNTDEKFIMRAFVRMKHFKTKGLAVADAFLRLRTPGGMPAALLAIMTICFLALVVNPSTALSQSVFCVRAGATGNNSGSDWNNAYQNLPATLQRGAIYYIADGSYGSHSFADTESGSTYIYLKKATVSDHGPSTGWQNSYGDGQVTFTGWTFSTGYYDINGVTGGGPGNWDSGFGIKLTVTKGGKRIVFNNNVDHITIRHAEITNADNSVGSDFGSLVYAFSNVTHITFSHCKIHHAYGCMIQTGYGGADYWTIEYSKLGDNTGDSTHSEIWSFLGNDNITLRYNWFYQWRSTGGLIAINGTEGSYGDAEICENWAIYGNVFDQSGSTAPYVIAAINDSSNQQVARRWKVYNNTFIGLNSTSTWVYLFRVDTYGESNNEFVNNVIYGNVDGMIVSASVENYNSYQGSSQYFKGAFDTSITSDPFVNYAARDLRLYSGSALPPGAVLDEIYSIDMYGNRRGADGTWDRGAFEYGGDNASPVLDTPKNLRVIM